MAGLCRILSTNFLHIYISRHLAAVFVFSHLNERIFGAQCLENKVINGTRVYLPCHLSIITLKATDVIPKLIICHVIVFLTCIL